MGAPAIVTQLERRLVLSDKVLRLHVDRRLKEWVYFVLKSALGRQQIESAATGNQLSMRNISQDALRSLAVPLPPKDELEALLAAVQSGWIAHRELDDSVGELGGSPLRQSILAAAFRGELS